MDDSRVRNWDHLRISAPFTTSPCFNFAELVPTFHLEGKYYIDPEASDRSEWADTSLGFPRNHKR